jgi:SAM-dependent methyltransferase
VRVPQLPERLRWDHNAHYHDWLRRQLPARCGHVLDVGCGSGRLACTLSTQADHVDALDRSAAMIEQARRRCPELPNVTWLEGDLLDPRLSLPDGTYDAITAVSSLHHMPLEPALNRLADLLRPGGVLVVVGHYRRATLGDRALELVALPANAALGLILALRGRAGKPDDEGMPVLPPSTSLGELRAAARLRLPGAILRRGLYWRYLLTWRRPETVPTAGRHVAMDRLGVPGAT